VIILLINWRCDCLYINFQMCATLVTLSHSINRQQMIAVWTHHCSFVRFSLRGVRSDTDFFFLGHGSLMRLSLFRSPQSLQCVQCSRHNSTTASDSPFSVSQFQHSNLYGFLIVFSPLLRFLVGFWFDTRSVRLGQSSSTHNKTVRLGDTKEFRLL